MPWDLDKVKAEIVSFMQSNYPGLPSVIIIAAEVEPAVVIDGKDVYALQVISFSNREDGITAALLAEALRGRVKSIGAMQDFLNNVAGQSQGTA